MSSNHGRDFDDIDDELDEDEDSDGDEVDGDEDEDSSDDDGDDSDDASDDSDEDADEESDDEDSDDDAEESAEQPAAQPEAAASEGAASAAAPPAAPSPVVAPKTGHAGLVELWKEIATTGGIEGWVTAQLNKKGLSVERVDTSEMSPKALGDYKKSLKAEAAERRTLRRQAWRAYRATHIVHVGEGVHWQDADTAPPAPDTGARSRRGRRETKPKPTGDRRDLPDADERAAENGLPPLDTPQQLADALGLTIPELRWMAFHRDAATRIHYRRFAIPKRDGSMRPIWAPLPKLKKAQRWIAHNIVDRLPVHGASHGFLIGRSTLTNASAHAASEVVLKIDIRGFFPTVTLPRVKGVFRKAGYRERVSTLLALLCTEAPREEVKHGGRLYYISMGPRCLPQGAPTSPSLTNTLCLRLDRRIAGVAAKLGWRYTRYADDLTFSLPSDRKGPPQTGKLMGAVRAIVEGEGFAVHPEKTLITRAGACQRVTGLVVNGSGTPRVPRKIRRQLRAAIHNLKNGKPLKNGDTPAALAGMAAYVNMTDAKLGAKLLGQLAST